MPQNATLSRLKGLFFLEEDLYTPYKGIRFDDPGIYTLLLKNCIICSSFSLTLVSIENLKDCKLTIKVCFLLIKDK